MGSSNEPRPTEGVSDLSRTRVSLRYLTELTDEEVRRWRRLEERALEPNIYLSYHFLRLQHLYCRAPARLAVVLVEMKVGGEPRCIAVVPVVEAPWWRSFPFPHLAGLEAGFSFLGGMSLDRDHARAASEALFDWLFRERWSWFGLRVRRMVWDSRQAEIIRATARRAGFTFRIDYRERRPVLADMHERSDWLAHVPKKRLKEWRRLRRKLTEAGETKWRCIRGSRVDDATIERFVELEHNSWKGDEGTSLRSEANDEAFFVECFRRMRAEDRVFMTELSLDGRVIASTANLRVQNAGFAFKVAFDPGYAKFSPGILNELEFLQRLDGESGFDLRTLDSGATEGSFIERLWPHSTELVDGVFTTNPVAVAYCAATRGLRRFRPETEQPLSKRGKVE